MSQRDPQRTTQSVWGSTTIRWSQGLFGAQGRPVRVSRRESNMASSRRPGRTRIRVGRRWSPWRLLFIIPMSLLSFIVPLASLFYVTRHVQLLLAAKEALFCTPTRLSEIILVVCLLLMALSLGGMFIALLSSPPRYLRAKDMRLLLTIGAIPLPIYLLSTGSMVCVNQYGVHYRPQLLASWHHYRFSQIGTVSAECQRGSRGGWDVRLYLTMSDGSSFDLAALYPWLPTSWQQGLGLLKDRPWDNSRINQDCPEPARNLIFHHQMSH